MNPVQLLLPFSPSESLAVREKQRPDWSLEKSQIDHILQVLDRANGDVRLAAKLLDIRASSLYRWLRDGRIDPLPNKSTLSRRLFAKPVPRIRPQQPPKRVPQVARVVITEPKTEEQQDTELLQHLGERRPPGQREVVTCGWCHLVQFRPELQTCRRCRKALLPKDEEAA